jgi:hypothetical protein
VDELVGIFHIRLVDGERYQNVRIVRWMRTVQGELLYLEDDEGTIYNWRNVAVLTKTQRVTNGV